MNTDQNIRNIIMKQNIIDKNLCIMQKEIREYNTNIFLLNISVLFMFIGIIIT